MVAGFSFDVKTGIGMVDARFKLKSDRLMIDYRKRLTKSKWIEVENRDKN